MSVLPKRLRTYIEEHTKKGSKMRKNLEEFLYRILVDGKVRARDVRSMSIKYHVAKMKRLGLLTTVKIDGITYIVISPEVLREI